MFAKKSLGQNFLTNPAITATIARAASLTPEDTVLEIGPGKGTLTRELLRQAKHVIAIEKDDALYDALRSTFADEVAARALTLMNADALTLEPCELGLTPQNFKIVANIPYNITGALIRHYLSNDIQPTTIVFLVQKEVAERIVARGGKESILSLSVKAYGTPSIAGIVKAGSFTPAPKVDSAILVIEHICRANFDDSAHEVRFFQYVKAGFAQKRKILLSNLKTVGIVLSPAQQSLVDANSRAEDLSLATWLELSRSEVNQH